MRLRQHTHIRITLIALLIFVVVAVTVFWHLTSLGNVNNPCTAIAASITNTSTPPLYLGLDAYRHWDKLSYLEFGDRVAGQSTTDSGGSNNDNSHILRVLPDGEHVLFDQVGPGIVTFMRMQENYGGPWNLSLDGQFKTTIGTNDLGQGNP